MKKHSEKNSLADSVRVLKKDRRFRPLIRKYGLPGFLSKKPSRGRNYFQSLCRSIISQQVSGAAADTIYRRFVGIFNMKESGTGAKFPDPEKILNISVEKLRSAGLSKQKVSYIRDLAQKFSDGVIDRKKLHKMSNKEVVEHLIQVKGIGEWTAHMFLIFTLNRIDVFPVGDLGVRKGFQKVYGFKKMPSSQIMQRYAKAWREHATLASWYFWQVNGE